MSVRHKGEFDDEQVEEATDNLGKPADADQLSRFAGTPDDFVWDDDDGEEDESTDQPDENDEADTLNTFCPTGKGGGVDPTCGDGSGGGKGGGKGGGTSPLPKPPQHWQKYAVDAATKRHPELKGKEFELRAIPLAKAKPTQTGEDYDNDSSRALAKAMKKVEVEGDDAINRAADYYPVVLDGKGNVLDGNHRHAAHAKNKYTHIWAMVPKGTDL